MRKEVLATPLPADPLSFCRKTTLTKHFRRQHGGRPRSTDGSESSDEDSTYEQVTQSARSVRHASSASTLPSQDLNVHHTYKRMHNYSHHPLNQLAQPRQHLTVTAMPRPHHPQAVYLSPNPSSNGAQGPPMYYPASGSGYPHTPNSMVHREIDEDYDSTSGTDNMATEPNAYHRLQMQQPKYQTYHSGMHGTAGPYPHPGDHSLGSYYGQNLPTPAVSPASSCSGPNNLPPPAQYSANGGASNSAPGHHSPPSTQVSTGGSQHQPTPYQSGHPPHNAAHPQAMHYAAAYSGHNRLYGEVQDGSMPRLHSYSAGQNGHSMPSEPSNHGLGISMSAQPMKVEVSTPMTGTAW